MEIQIWSDVVCPWCYLGKRRFEHALAEFVDRDQVNVVHRAFQLAPDMPKGQTQDQLEMLIEKYGASAEQIAAQQEQLVQLAAAEGLDYQLAGGRAGNTFDAHQVVRLGLEHGRQDAVIERLFRAHFVEQRSVFEPDSLVELAAEAGLDPDETRTVLKEDRYADDVRQDIDLARQYGANGVPFFVIDDRYGISGAQPTEAFSGALVRAWTDHPRDS
jgi:predicted DsbA family dithiol-disulfide isomerase